MANATTRMLWFALVASQGMYGVVAWLVEVPPGDGELVTVLTPVFALLSGDAVYCGVFGSAAVAMLWFHRPTSPDLVPPMGDYRTAPPIY